MYVTYRRCLQNINILDSVNTKVDRALNSFICLYEHAELRDCMSYSYEIC